VIKEKIMANVLRELEKFGQSVWIDNISRGMLKKGELKRLVEEDGVTGVTSNPTIFQKAIGKGNDYDEQIKSLLSKRPDLNAQQLFEKLAVKDIQDGTDILSGVYEKTNGNDGFVSLEVSPELAYDTKNTIEEARRLFKEVNRKNVMIKIPATQEGIPAIRQMISEGANINITLIFAQSVYEQVVDAYLSGLEDRVKDGKEIDKITSVASFFISRIDTAVDDELSKVKNEELKGKIAIANGKLVYEKFLELFSSKRFKNLEAKGAKVQKVLWASTSTKNPAYSDILYVEELIGPKTVNTMPPATMAAYNDHGYPVERLTKNVDEARAQMKNLAELNIDFSVITRKLTEKGVVLFSESFKELMREIDRKKNEILSKVLSL
jgi:transaldolase/glucose-6-phosphate isomerase